MHIAVFPQVHAAKFYALGEIFFCCFPLLLVLYGGVKQKLDALLPTTVDVTFLQHERRIIVEAFRSHLALLVGHLALWVQSFQF